MLMRMALGYHALLTIQRQAVTASDPDLLSTVRDLKEKMGIRRPVSLKTSSEIDSPFTCGLFSPEISGRS